MKQGRTLSELAAEIERQNESKKDFVAKTTTFAVVPHEGGVALDLRDNGIFPISAVAHEQIAEHAKIPKVYYDRMLAEAPQLLTTNITEWFTKYPAARMIRTLDGKARAFLSDKYQPFDNYDFAGAALPVLAQRKLNIVSCEVTEKKLYIKAVDEKLYRDVPVGYKMGDGSHQIYDTCAPVIILTNSEVGFGRLAVDSGVYTSACTNLCWFAKGGLKRTHVGARHAITDGIENIESILTGETKQKMLEALWLQVKDVVAAAFDEKVVGERLEVLAVAAGRKIEGKVEKVLEVTQKRFGLNDGERESIFKHLIEGGNLSQYGLHAAITRSAQDVESYDRATDLETLGGRIVQLDRTQWQELSLAA